MGRGWGRAVAGPASGHGLPTGCMSRGGCNGSGGLLTALACIALLACTPTLDGGKFLGGVEDGGMGGRIDPPDASTVFDAGTVFDAPTGPSCGDGACADGESVCTCAEDCGRPTCGDAICCRDIEDSGSCGEDCAPSCGDGLCVESENRCSCPGDCGGPSCGDGVCCAGAGEDRCSCPADCGAGAVRRPALLPRRRRGQLLVRGRLRRLDVRRRDLLRERGRERVRLRRRLRRGLVR